MIQRYEAYMDGTALSSIDNSIVITDIAHEAANYSRKFDKVASRDGSRLVSSNADSCGVSITFMIREYNTMKRQEICQKVAKWATQGNYLTTSDRRWQKLRCVCEKAPSISSKGWTDEVTVEFKAYNPPFWQEENVSSLTLGGTNGSAGTSGVMHVPGNVKNDVVSVSITAKASIDTLFITVNGKTMYFYGLTLQNGDVMTIDYDDNMNLRIRKGSTSLMSKRSANSADDLLADCGKSNTFSYTASAKAIVTFTVRGWWL